MIRLERHIEILLLENDCVIVPTFGGFMAHHVNARYDDDECLFLPPLRAIGFNAQLKMNDSMLVQSYIEAYDISYPEALKCIEEEAEELKSHLDNNGFYELNNIGVISKNEDSNYIFAPCEAGLLTPYLYGLNSIEFEKRKNVNQITTKPTPVIPINSGNSQVEGRENVLNIDEKTEEQSINTLDNETLIDENDEENSSKTISIKLSWIRNIAVACFILIAVMLMPLPLDNGNSSSILKSNINASMLCMLMPKDVQTDISNANMVKLDKKVATKVNAKPSINPVDAHAKALKDTIPSEKNDYFGIVLASRITKANAEIFVKQLQKNGLQNVVVLPRKVGAKVIYGQFKTENAAYNALNKLHTDDRFADAWVMRVSKN